MDTWDWEVKSVVIHKFENLTQDNYHILRKHWSFKLPNNEPLFQIDEGSSTMLTELLNFKILNLLSQFPHTPSTIHHQTKPSPHPQFRRQKNNNKTKWY